MYFKRINHLAHFLHKEMSINNTDKIPTLAVWKFVKRLSAIPSGRKILDLYGQAISAPSKARDALCNILQMIEPLYATCNVIGHDPDAAGVDETVDTRLKDLIEEAKTSSKEIGIDTDKLYAYLTECRNISVHSGLIISGFSAVGTRFNINMNDLYKESAQSEQGNANPYTAICSLIMASAVIFYYAKARKSSLFGWQFIQYPVYTVSFCLLYVRWFFQLITKFFYILYGLVAGTFYVGVGALFIAFYLAVAAVVICIVHWGLKQFDDNVEFTKANPTELAQWVDDQTPIEQMTHFYDRSQALHRLYDYYGYGDTILCKADERTHELYEWAVENKMPNQRAWYYMIMPNIPQMARIPVLGTLFNIPGKPEIFMHSEEDSTAYKSFNMPIYDEGYYVLLNISDYRNQSNDRRTALWTMYARELKKYPSLTFAIQLGTRNLPSDLKESKKVREGIDAIAKGIKQAFTSNGISASRVRVIECDNVADSYLLVKGIPSE